MKHKLSPLLLGILVLTNGCSYLRNRGLDALDIVDVGVTFTDKTSPDFAIFADFFSITPVGYSRIDGKVFGIGNRQIGWLDYEDRCWGVLLWGSEKKGSGKFNPKDPHQARVDQQDLKTRPRFNTGILRMSLQDNLPPLLQFLECDRCVHLGWIGVHATIRPFDLLDFILGWTTLDILGDDPPPTLKEE